MTTVSEEGQKLVRLREIVKGCSLFGVAVNRVIREFGVSEGNAINMVAKDAGPDGAKLYNQFCAAGRPQQTL